MCCCAGTLCVREALGELILAGQPSGAHHRPCHVSDRARAPHARAHSDRTWMHAPRGLARCRVGRARPGHTRKAGFGPCARIGFKPIPFPKLFNLVQNSKLHIKFNTFPKFMKSVLLDSMENVEQNSSLCFGSVSFDS
jgi:hypothetical protein